MCGIAGIINGSLEAADMAYLLRHRGPDAQRVMCVVPGIHFGHARLSIIDLSEAGNQPMQFGKWTITYNGEIYNYRELRGHLQTKGHTFKTQTDTEVLLHAWAEYGKDCLHALDGQFAFGICNIETRELTLVRDRAGEKPLYYLSRNGKFAFASELRALADLSERRVSQEALALYALYRYVPAPKSAWSDVAKLPPGHLLTVDAAGKVTVKRWWSWEVEPTHEVSQKGFRDACEGLEAALLDSVRRRLLSDVPLGLFLSGGIDSSLTAALVCKLGHKPKTFTIGFEGKGSEHEQARLIAKHLGTEHRERIFTSSEVERVCRDLGSHMDEPNGDRSCAPTFLLSQFAKSEVTVALSGDGGDELFGGYTRYAHPCNSSTEYYNRLLPVYGGEAPSDDALWQTHEPLHALRSLDFNRYLPGCVLSKMDRMSMRHSLEVRTPYLEPTIMDIARKLPAAYLMNGQMGKLVLREIAGRHLPKEIALAPKRGFGMPKAVFQNNANLMNELMEEARPHCEKIGMPPPPNNANAFWNFIVLGQWVASL